MPDDIERLRAALSGQYDVQSEAGSGGMATVYLARDLKHDRQVAVKVLRSELAATLGPDRFPREIKIVAQLQHPHILPLYDSGESDGFLYFVMPFIDGESLRAKLDREGQLPVRDAVRILREVVDALSYAHGKGVLHRDIKPENVMLSGKHAIVMDFGVAKALSDAGGENITTMGIAVGTPKYMSPEQATGEPHLDHRSDIYAVGILGCELLTGEPPFSGKTSQAILAAQVMQPPTDIRSIRPAVPQALSDALGKCLEKNPADRWQSADELMPALEAVGTSSAGVTPTETPPVDVTPTAAPRMSRRTWLAAVGAVAVMLVVAAGGWMLRGGGGPATIEQIAVMPLMDLSGQDQLFVDTFHDALISALAQTNTAGVVSRTAVLRLGAIDRTDEIAEQLGVQALVEGTVFRAGDRMRVNVQMVEPTSLRHLWTQSYDRDVTDVLDVQAEMVSAIATELGAVLVRTDVDDGE